MVLSEQLNNRADGKLVRLIGLFPGVWVRRIIEPHTGTLIEEKIRVCATFTRLLRAKKIGIIQLPRTKHLDESFHILLSTDIMCQLFSQNWNFSSWLRSWEAPFGLCVWIRFFFNLFSLYFIHHSVFISISGQSVLYSLFMLLLFLEGSAIECVYVCVRASIFYVFDCKRTLKQLLLERWKNQTTLNPPPVNFALITSPNVFWLSCLHQGVVWCCFWFP